MTLQEMLATIEAGLKKDTTHDQDTITIQGSEVAACSPEGSRATISVETLLAKVAARRMDTGGVVLPDGVKAVISEGGITIWIYESPPSVQRFKWIAADSPSPFGKETKYREVRIALPYLIVLAVFSSQANGQLQLTSANECFFRTAPLKSLEEGLYFPALLNCSRFTLPEGRPLSWICTQHLRPTPAMRDPDVNQAAVASFDALRRCLLETGFNLSSEHHEGSSWFTSSREVDRRIATVEAWEAATSTDPLFVLEVPWLKTHHTVRRVCERIFKNQQAQAHSIRTASALARIIFNHPQPSKSRPAPVIA